MPRESSWDVKSNWLKGYSQRKKYNLCESVCERSEYLMATRQYIQSLLFKHSFNIGDIIEVRMIDQYCWYLAQITNINYKQYRLPVVDSVRFWVNDLDLDGNLIRGAGFIGCIFNSFEPTYNYKRLDCKSITQHIRKFDSFSIDLSDHKFDNLKILKLKGKS